MALKKLQGDLDVIGNYKGNGALMLTTADCAYDPTMTYEVGQVCSHPENKGIFTCIETATGTWDLDKWITPSTYLGDVPADGQQFSKYLNLIEAGQLLIDLTGATVTNDTTTHTIKIVKSGAIFPASGTAADNKFLALLKGGAIRHVIWPSFAPAAGLVAQVTFDSYFLDMSQIETDDFIGLQLFSPACTLTIESIVAPAGSETTTVLIKFSDDAAVPPTSDVTSPFHSPYQVISQLIAMNQYDRVVLDPVIAYLP